MINTRVKLIYIKYDFNKLLLTISCYPTFGVKYSTHGVFVNKVNKQILALSR